MTSIIKRDISRAQHPLLAQSSEKIFESLVSYSRPAVLHAFRVYNASIVPQRDTRDSLADGPNRGASNSGISRATSEVILSTLKHSHAVQT